MQPTLVGGCYKTLRQQSFRPRTLPNPYARPLGSGPVGGTGLLLSML